MKPRGAMRLVGQEVKKRYQRFYVMPWNNNMMRVATDLAETMPMKAGDSFYTQYNWSQACGQIDTARH